MTNSLFMKEEKALGFLKCYDIFNTEGNLFLIYEFMDGGTIEAAM